MSSYTTVVTRTITDVDVIYPSTSAGSNSYAPGSNTFTSGSGPGYTSVATAQGHNLAQGSQSSTPRSGSEATSSPGSGPQFSTVIISDYSSGSPYAPHTVTGSAPAAGTCVPEKTIYSTVVVEITKTVEHASSTQTLHGSEETFTFTLPNGQPITITTVISQVSTTYVTRATTVPNSNGAPGSHVEYTTIALHSQSAQPTFTPPFPSGNGTIPSASGSGRPRGTGTVSLNLPTGTSSRLSTSSPLSSGGLKPSGSVRR